MRWVVLVVTENVRSFAMPQFGSNAATWSHNGSKFANSETKKLRAMLVINVLTSADRAWYNARKNGGILKGDLPCRKNMTVRLVVLCAARRAT